MSNAFDWRSICGHMGNPRLRRPFQQGPLTQDQIDEIRKCQADPVYFACNYIKIVHVDKGLVNFEMWDFQKDMLRQFTKERFNIVKTARQVGKSTVTIAFILHDILFHKHRRVAVLANKGLTSRELLARLRLAYENLPAWLQQGIITWNKGDIELENGSVVMAASTTSSAVRGYSFTMIFLDEFAFVPTNIANDFFMSTYPTISSGKDTKVIIVSTPNGMNHFYKRWRDAEENVSDFKPFSVHWSSVPGRDAKWKEETIRNTTPEQFAQEMEAEFLGSTQTLISGAKLRNLAWKTPIFSENGYDVYERAIKGHSYAVTLDVSRGQGQDYQAASVFDITEFPYKQVAKLRDNTLETILVPTIIFNICKQYNDAHLLVELNDVGQQVAESLHYEFGYENLIKIETKPKLGQIAASGFKKRMQLGVKTSVATKKIGCANLKALIENDKLIIEDEDTIMELTTFIANKETYRAEPGAHDDLAMTLVLFGWIINQRFFKDSIGTDLRVTLQEEKLRMEEEQLVPHFIFDDGTDDRKIMDDNDKTLWFEERREKYPFDDMHWGKNPFLER